MIRLPSLLAPEVAGNQVSTVSPEQSLVGIEIMTLEQLASTRKRARRLGYLLRPIWRLLQKPWLCCLLLIAAGSMAHVPALQGPFLWDDTYLALTNPFIKSPLLIFESFRHYLFLDSYSLHYRPVQNISYMPDYFLWGDNPFGFHLSNVFWHVAAGTMLFLLLRRLLAELPRTQLCSNRSQFIALLIALLWVVHPVHSAAVDYVSGRADSLAFFFAAAAWLTFLCARRSSSACRRTFIYAISFLLGLLALCSRETGILWLILFLVWQLFVNPQMNRRAKLIIVAGCLTLTLAYIGLRHLPSPRSQVLSAAGWPAATRAVLMLRALGDYGRLMVFPSNLHMERTVFNPAALRDSSMWESNSVVEYLSIAGLGFLAILIFGLLRKETGRELRILGAVWFLVAYVPVSNLINLNATVAEHWLYLPSVGFLIFLAGCALALPQRLDRWVLPLVGAFIIGLSVRSYDRSSDWANSERFFRQTLAAGGSSGRAATNLALVYSRRGEYARAEELLRHVLQISPDDPIARNNLADALRHLGRNAEAENILIATSKAREQIAKDYPRTWVIAANLARLRHAQKNDSAACVILDKARRQDPDVWELVSYEGELLRENKGPGAAQQLVEDFARRNWWHYGAALALGRIYAEKGQVTEAIEALTRASRLDLHEVEALNLLAQIRLRQHRFQDAYLAQRRATDRQPDAPRQYVLLSDILQKMGRPGEAHDALAQVKRLQDAARENGSLIN